MKAVFIDLLADDSLLWVKHSRVSHVLYQGLSDGGRSNGGLSTSDLSATRASGVPNTPIAATPGSRGAANMSDNSRIV
jgi:hypothetical protein